MGTRSFSIVRLMERLEINFWKIIRTRWRYWKTWNLQTKYHFHSRSQ